MNMLICDFNFGDRNAKIYIVKNNIVTEIRDDIGQAPNQFIPALFEIGNEHGCYEVRFNGTEDFIEYYIQQAQKYALKNYSENDKWTFTLMKR